MALKMQDEIYFWCQFLSIFKYWEVSGLQRQSPGLLNSSFLYYKRTEGWSYIITGFHRQNKNKPRLQNCLKTWAEPVWWCLNPLLPYTCAENRSHLKAKQGFGRPAELELQKIGPRDRLCGSCHWQEEQENQHKSSLTCSFPSADEVEVGHFKCKGCSEHKEVK